MTQDLIYIPGVPGQDGTLKSKLGCECRFIRDPTSILLSPENVSSPRNSNQAGQTLVQTEEKPVHKKDVYDMLIERKKCEI